MTELQYLPPKIPTELEVQWALQSRIYLDWLKSLDREFAVTAIRFQAVDFKGKPGPDNILFIRMGVKASNAPYEQIVELRGGTVILLPLIRCEGKLYTILVRQPRLAVGSANLLELPAGMIDGGSFKGAALRELEEEVGFVCNEDHLTHLGACYLSPGLLDEKAKVYRVEVEMTLKELKDREQQVMGVKEEHESLGLKVIPFEDLPFATQDGKALIAWAMYQRWAFGK